MPDNNNNTMVDFCTPEKENNTIIKVIGVGGGGGNAVNHMYREGIHDVSFVLCNTDNQALNDSPVPVLLQLGTEGLGAGNKPAKARQAAEESLDAIKNMLSDGTKMTFITAGMGFFIKSMVFSSKKEFPSISRIFPENKSIKQSFS